MILLRWRSTISAAATVAAMTCCAARLYGGDLEDLRRAWRVRQERVHSGSFVWTGTSVLNGRMRMPYFMDPVGEPLPSLITQLSVTAQLDGIKLNCAVEALGDYDPSSIIGHRRSVFDGIAARTRSRKAGGQLYGTIHANGQADGSSQFHWLPMLLALRGLDARLTGLDLVQFEIAEAREDVDGHSCLVLDERVDAAQRRSLSVDPAAEYVVRRIIWFVEGRRASWFDIQYEPEASYPWLPAAWQHTQVAAETQEFVQSMESRLTSFALNQPIPPDAFVLEFPPGTVVHDEATDSTHIVREDLSRREILPQERGFPLEELKATETGMAGVRGPTPRVRWFILGNLVLAVSALAWLLYRRRRRAAPPAA